jgi:hypothetical protein
MEFEAQKFRLRLLLVLALVTALYALLVFARADQFSVLWFVHIGKQSLGQGSSSHVITPALHAQSKLGYDGQYYYFLARDPRNARDYMGARAGFVYSRPVYPALSRAASLGSARALPYAMLIINLLAVVVGTLAVGGWLLRRRLSPGYALLYGLNPGLMFSVFRDLTEPLAFAFVAVALFVMGSRLRFRLSTAAALFALAALTRETTLVFGVAAALGLAARDSQGIRASWRSWSPWRRSALFLLACCGPLLIWRRLVGSYVHTRTQERGTELVPFRGIAAYWPWDAQHLLILGTVVLPTVAAVLGALILLRHRAEPMAAATLLVSAAAFVVFLPIPVYVDYGAAGRAAIGVVLALIYCIPAWTRLTKRSRRLATSTAWLWSIAWYLALAAALGISGLPLVTS